MKHQVITLDSIVHATFVEVTSIEPGHDVANPSYCLRLGCTNDPDVDGMILRISEDRAKELGLVH